MLYQWGVKCQGIFMGCHQTVGAAVFKTSTSNVRKW